MMNSISISAVLLAAIVLFASVFVVALASSLLLKKTLYGSLLLKKTLYGSLQQDNLSVSVAVRRTFMVSLVVALLLVYYFLSTTA
ncbi:TPA: hypothetical protein ACKRDI_000810 [Proteus mirabilis]